MLTEEREKNLVDLCSELIRIRSYSGEEQQIIHRLEQVVEDKGCSEAYVDEYGSISASFKGKRPGKKLLFDCHVDTVPVTDPDQWTMDPFGGQVIDGAVYGRGASDMKGALAAVLTAAEMFVEDTQADFAGEIIISGVVHEESFEGIASRIISSRVRPDVVIICEATDLNLNRGQRGRAEIVVETFGKPAHSANPKAGVNAVYQMTELISRIKDLPAARHRVLGDGILELTDIKSSPYPGLSVVPDYCRATFDRRLLVGETDESVLLPINELIKECSKKDPHFNARASYSFGRETCFPGGEIKARRFFPGWLFDEREEFVQTAYQGLKRMGLAPEVSTYSFCTNGSHYAGEAGYKTLGFGPSIEAQAHVNDESVSISQLTGACHGYFGIMKSFLGDGQ